MGKLGPPYTPATVVNNIFRNYEHKWVYDFEEFVAVSKHAGIPASQVTRSTRRGADLGEQRRQGQGRRRRRRAARARRGGGGDQALAAP